MAWMGSWWWQRQNRCCWVPAPKSAFQIDHPSAVQAHSQRGVECVCKRAGLSLAHAFQLVAHVKAVITKDGNVGLGREFAVLGDPHTLALEGPTDAVGTSVHAEPGSEHAVVIVFGPGSLELNLGLLVGPRRREEVNFPM